MTRPLKILAIDIETAPRLVYVWRLYNNQNISWKQAEKDLFLLSWAAGWIGKKGIRGKVLTPHEVKTQDDLRIVQELRDLIVKADALLGHNIDKFDLPIINSRLAANGLEPLPRIPTLDTLKLAKRAFGLGFASHSLGYLAKALDLPYQKEVVDFDLWRDAYSGDVGALHRLLRYNRQDVRTLRALYERVHPYVKLPVLVEASSMEDGIIVCPYCGGEVVKWGLSYTTTQKYQRWKCKVCHRHSRSRYAQRGKTYLRPE